MDLPVNPPVAPMLAKPVAAIPDGDYVFEPKWDGFRSIVFRDGGEIEIGSRNERPMTRYFPELVAAFRAQLPERCVIDGEIVVPDGSGRRLDFEALQLRITRPPAGWMRWRSRPRRISWRSTCWRSAASPRWNGRSANVGASWSGRWPGWHRRCT